MTSFASGLDHPRWIYVLPNGDVLVAESNAPPKGETEGWSLKGWVMGLVKKRAGAKTPSANRITLLRDARRARTLQHQASRRAQDNLDHLAHLAPLQKNQPANPAVLLNALAGATQAWATLKEALEARQTAAALLGTDAQAEALLQAAETLTDALETHGARRALHIINLCGRQRMRSQRLAKEALLATLPGQEARALRLGTLLDDFEAALLELERAPLSTPDTRTMLAQARDEWLRLLRGLRSAEGDEGRAALAGSADALLDLFDQLTNAYEHSLQVLMA